VRVYLKDAPLPAQYSVSISVANLTACVGVVWDVDTLAGSSFYMSLTEPQSPACSGSYSYYGCTIQPDLTCLQNTVGRGGGSLGTGSHTITVRVDGATMSLMLDGTSLGTLTESTRPVLNGYDFGVGNSATTQQSGAATPSADFSDFSIQS